MDKPNVAVCVCEKGETKLDEVCNFAIVATCLEVEDGFERIGAFHGDATIECIAVCIEAILEAADVMLDEIGKGSRPLMRDTEDAILNELKTFAKKRKAKYSKALLELDSSMASELSEPGSADDPKDGRYIILEAVVANGASLLPENRREPESGE